MGVALENRLRIVWWRASTVTMDAASVRTFMSWMMCAAPRYAPTPTFSMSRAADKNVVTSVRTLVKSNEQVVSGVSANDVMISCTKVSEASKEGWANEIVDTNLERGNMGRFVTLDGGYLLDGRLRGSKASIGVIRCLELRQSLLVEICLELLQDICEL